MLGTWRGTHSKLLYINHLHLDVGSRWATGWTTGRARPCEPPRPDRRLLAVQADAPIEFEVAFKNYQPSQLLAYLPQVERIDSHSIRFVGDDMIDVSTFFTFMMNYDSSLEP